MTLKGCCAALAAKTIGLTANDFGHRRPSGNKYTAHGILYHLILRLRQTFLGSSPKLPEGASEQEVQDDQQDKNDDDSIHSRGASRLPQSYGSVEGVSTADVNGHERQFRTSIAPMA